MAGTQLTLPALYSLCGTTLVSQFLQTASTGTQSGSNSLLLKPSYVFPEIAAVLSALADPLSVTVLLFHAPPPLNRVSELLS